MTEASSEIPFQPVAEAGSVPVGETREATIDGVRILICNFEGTLYAIADVCTHDGQVLGESSLIGCMVECPRHGARFDVTNGKATALPAVKPIATYPVRESGGRIEVQYQPPAKKPPARSGPPRPPFRR